MVPLSMTAKLPCCLPLDRNCCWDRRNLRLRRNRRLLRDRIRNIPGWIAFGSGRGNPTWHCCGRCGRPGSWPRRLRSTHKIDPHMRRRFLAPPPRRGSPLAHSMTSSIQQTPPHSLGPRTACCLWRG